MESECTPLQPTQARKGHIGPVDRTSENEANYWKKHMAQAKVKSSIRRKKVPKVDALYELCAMLNDAIQTQSASKEMIRSHVTTEALSRCSVGPPQGY